MRVLVHLWHPFDSPPHVMFWRKGTFWRPRLHEPSLLKVQNGHHPFVYFRSGLLINHSSIFHLAAINVLYMINLERAVWRICSGCLEP